jgi:hypothetical protein
VVLHPPRREAALSNLLQLLQLPERHRVRIAELAFFTFTFKTVIDKSGDVVRVIEV